MSNTVIKIGAIFLGLAPIIFVGSVGVAFMQPPQRKTPEWLVLSPLESLPDNGLPVRMVVTAPHWDSWTRLPDQCVGAVYARRIPGTRDVRVISAVHGKFGVQVDYDPATDGFLSQYFVVRFNAEGKVLTDDIVKESKYEDIETIPAQVTDGNVLVRLSAQWQVGPNHAIQPTRKSTAN